MSALTPSNTRRFVCMLMATALVAGSLALGAFSSYHKTHGGYDSYSVTITQLQ